MTWPVEMFRREDAQRFASIANAMGSWQHDWHWERDSGGNLTRKGAQDALRDLRRTRESARKIAEDASPLIGEIERALEDGDRYWPPPKTTDGGDS